MLSPTEGLWHVPPLPRYAAKFSNINNGGGVYLCREDLRSHDISLPP